MNVLARGVLLQSVHRGVRCGQAAEDITTDLKRERTAATPGRFCHDKTTRSEARHGWGHGTCHIHQAARSEAGAAKVVQRLEEPHAELLHRRRADNELTIGEPR